MAATLGVYQQMITDKPADLIVTPETALPLFARQIPLLYWSELRQFATQSGSYLAVGVPDQNQEEYTNSVLVLEPLQKSAKATLYRYDKHHLVPFGEFIPRGFRWFVNLMNIPLGDFARGALIQPPFAVGDQWILPNICYEDLFGEEIAAQIAASAHGGQPFCDDFAEYV